ncbi:MAG: hypothetical protein H7X89_14875 [Rhizobiales bacterium]|nr:hypothetical protein [Hyphomicrobiales bacterium]
MKPLAAIYSCIPPSSDFSGLVGAELIFAGIIDWCGLGMLIARMPWSQLGSGAC